MLLNPAGDAGMIYILCATNRPGANSLIVAGIIQQIYQELNQKTEIISLQDIPFQQLLRDPYPDNLPEDIKRVVSKLNNSSGIIFVCPEYNGSFPGILKFFIDHWSYPQTFEYRPTVFVGLGGRFGGLRAVEQLQQIMSYRNAFMYPQRVFLQNISDILSKEGKIKDLEIMQLLTQQAKGFVKFVRALEAKQLSSCARVPQGG